MNRKFIYGVKLATLSGHKWACSPRIHTWAPFQEPAGVWCMEKYVIHMIFYPSDRMYIYVAIFHSFCRGHWESPHLSPVFKSHGGRHVWDLHRGRRAGINHCRHFYLDGSHTSPILLCLRIVCLDGAWVWWLRCLVTEGREESHWGPLPARLSHWWLNPPNNCSEL